MISSTPKFFLDHAGRIQTLRSHMLHLYHQKTEKRLNSLQRDACQLCKLKREEDLKQNPAERPWSLVTNTTNNCSHEHIETFEINYITIKPSKTTTPDTTISCFINRILISRVSNVFLKSKKKLHLIFLSLPIPSRSVNSAKASINAKVYRKPN